MSLFSSIAVAASGMTAQRQRAEVLVENIANAETTRTANGGPYQRQDVVFDTQQVGDSFTSVFEAQLNPQSSGVAVDQIVVDQSPPDMRYSPGHPDANKDGYVAFPKMSPAEDMVDLQGASRGYEANVSAIASVKDMIERSLDLFK